MTEFTVKRSNTTHLKVRRELYSRHGKVYVYHVLDFAEKLKEAVEAGMNPNITEVSISEYALTAEQTLTQEIP